LSKIGIGDLIKMTADQLRQKYLRFFEGKGHKVIPSSSLLPQGDTTLLLTNAGMVQFKAYFMGEPCPYGPRLASCQKCFRTTDIELVGDFKHLTFFEMLGNFSIGDYFKREAIAYAWEFVTEHLGLPKQRLWITIFLDDDESFRYWRELGVPEERIVRYGEDNNFWGPAGEEGPCGPCAEIHYDFGEGFGCGKPDCAPACECGRFLELWNLVFTEYYQDRAGHRRPLPQKNVDTGMGLERTIAVLQGKHSFYETDLFAPIIERVSELSGKKYGCDEKTDKALRIVAEHGRAIPFLIADGVMPSNEGRGYVLRRVLRRAALFGRELGIRRRFLEDIAIEVIERMQHVYPELKRNYVHIRSVIDEEEKRFRDTLDFGLDLLDRLLEGGKFKTAGKIPGEDAFYLYDTYGLPKEILAEVAKERGFEVDWEGFEREMEQQRERARAAQKSKTGEIAEAPAYTNGRGTLPMIKFVGDDNLKLKHHSVVLLLTQKGVWKTRLFEGDEGDVVLRETPFYGEMGGQVGDTGEILGPKGRFIVEDTIRLWPELPIHRGKVVAGYITLDDTVEAVVDKERRLDIARNHTATHLLHAALRQVLGSHVWQQGSLVAPDRLRFDFSHYAPVSEDELRMIQQLVNEKIRHNLKVEVQKNIPYAQAIAEGALAFFGEKYGDTVRVIKIESPDGVFSAELCGGTHVSQTGEVGLFYIVSESSVGAGLRRIEAVTGRGAEAFVAQHISTLEAIAQQLQSPLTEVQNKVANIITELDRERKRIAALEQKLAKGEAENLLSQLKLVNGIPVLVAEVSASSMETLRQMGDSLKERLGSAVILLGAIWDDKPHFLSMVTSDLVSEGLNAAEIVKRVAEVTGGSGGGRPNLGQAGGKDKGKLREALRLVPRLVESVQSLPCRPERSEGSQGQRDSSPSAQNDNE
jgi:alanyl-tRNA synthetase